MPWNRAQRRLSKAPCDVYRVYDRTGALLYVGASTNAFKRLREHRPYSEWWVDAHTGTIHRYARRDVARHVEALAIRDERPLWNVTQERSELVRDVDLTEPIETLALFWEDGEVWVDAY